GPAGARARGRSYDEPPWITEGMWRRQVGRGHGVLPRLRLRGRQDTLPAVTEWTRHVLAHDEERRGFIATALRGKELVPEPAVGAVRRHARKDACRLRREARERLHGLVAEHQPRVRQPEASNRDPRTALQDQPTIHHRTLSASFLIQTQAAATASCSRSPITVI